MWPSVHSHSAAILHDGLSRLKRKKACPVRNQPLLMPLGVRIAPDYRHRPNIATIGDQEDLRPRGWVSLTLHSSRQGSLRPGLATCPSLVDAYVRGRVKRRMHWRYGEFWDYICSQMASALLAEGGHLAAKRLRRVPTHDHTSICVKRKQYGQTVSTSQEVPLWVEGMPRRGHPPRGR